MTVTTPTNFSGPYLGNGLTTVFPRTFRAVSADHVRIYRTTAGETEEVVSGFTLEDIGEDEGDVVFDVAPTSEDTILIIRDVPVEQTSDYSNQGTVSPESFESDLDLSVMREQDTRQLIYDITGRVADGVASVEDKLEEVEAHRVTVEAVRDIALAALDNFDDRYLGQFATAPTLDNEGQPLTSGALYYDTVENGMLVYDGIVWLPTYSDLTGALTKSGNLEGLANKATARTNLGLGSAATTESSIYAKLAAEGIGDAAWFIDEDDLASEAATKVPSQQSVKNFVENLIAQETAIEFKSYSNSNGWDSWIIAENFNGDTGVSLLATEVYRCRIKNFAYYSIKLTMEGFSKQVDNDATFSGRFDIGAFCSNMGWGYGDIQQTAIASAVGTFYRSDADWPEIALECHVNSGGSYPDSVYFRSLDRKTFDSTSANATGMKVWITFATKVG